MKVDHSQPPYGTSGSFGIDANGPRANAQVATGTPASDTLSISGDVELAERAMAAAKSSLDIRPDAVARGKALIESGRAGADAEAIADAMIDRLLDSWRMD
jgi:anti-sigma28 factor (negative regulator of flagellin synthesis)